MVQRVGPDNGGYGTAVGEWICNELWPVIWKGIGWCVGRMLLGLLFGLGFWFAQYIVNLTVLVYM
jgi:hypothetical protein